MSSTTERTIRVGHSPDSDDAFMFYALTHGKLDAAFNNAGDGLPPTPPADIAVEAFDGVVAVDLRGVFSP